MKYSYNWLAELVDLRGLSPSQVAKQIDEHSFEVENVSPAKFAGVADFVLNIETGKTNRVDALGHWGMAKEISAIVGRPMRQQMRLDLTAPKDKPTFKVQIDKKFCRKYLAWRFTGIKVKPSPAWLKSRLLACGLKPICNVVDIANYAMLLTGQPLHAFDAARIKGGVIRVRKAKNREKLKTLDGEVLQLTNQDLVIADLAGPIGLAGIKGGADTAVSSRTKTIILESANFDPVLIRRTSWRVGLRTDAAHRFEKNLPLPLADSALAVAGELLQKLSEAVPAELVSAGLTKHPNRVVNLPRKYLNSLLGVELSSSRVGGFLKRLGFPSKETRFTFRVSIPFYRPDLALSEDLIEEIGRLAGYNQIPESKLSVNTQSRTPGTLRRRDLIRSVLVGMGFCEVQNYSFYGRDTASEFGLKPSAHLELENPLSRDQEYLRLSLLPGLAKNVKDNLRFFDQCSLFEFGNIYEIAANSKHYHDRMRLGLAVANREKNSKVLYQELRGRLEQLFQLMHVSADFEPAKVSDWARGGAAIFINSQKIGQINSQFGNGAASEFAGAELYWEELLNALPSNVRFKAFSRFPTKVLDLSVVVNQNVLWSQIFSLLRDRRNQILRGVFFLNSYTGSSVPQGKKSVAMRLVFQSADHTLTDEEATAQLKILTKILANKLGAKVRE